MSNPTFILNAAVEFFINQRDIFGVLDHVHPQGESIPSFQCSNTPGFIRKVRLFPKSQQLNLDL